MGVFAFFLTFFSVFHQSGLPVLALKSAAAALSPGYKVQARGFAPKHQFHRLSPLSL
jgi:hypothetical protein